MFVCAVMLSVCVNLTLGSSVVVADLDQEVESEDAPLPWRVGPQPLSLGHGIELALPHGYQFLGLPHAARVMTQLGNLYNDNLLGMVVSSAPEQDAGESESDGYLITLRYDAEGYIKDDEELDGEAILESIRSAEDDYNAQRREAGFAAIHAEGWQEPPRYDRARHHVVWGLLVSSPDDPEPTDRSVNFNTRVLGRKGYVSVNLVTDSALLSTYKPAASAILAATSFGPGKRYEDFDASSDKVAEYGLTGLVLGGVGLGVAKLVKVGLLAKFGKLIIAALIAGKKGVAVLFVAVAAGLRKLLRRRRDRISQV